MEIAGCTSQLRRERAGPAGEASGGMNDHELSSDNVTVSTGELCTGKDEIYQ